MDKIFLILLYIISIQSVVLASTTTDELVTAFDTLCLQLDTPPKQRMYQTLEKKAHYQKLLQEDHLISSLAFHDAIFDASGMMEHRLGQEYFVHQFSYPDSLNKALNLFQRALALGDKSATLSIAHVYMNQRDFSKSKEWLKKALFWKAIEKGNYCVELGLILLEQMDLDNALHAFCDSQTFQGYLLASQHATHIEDKIAFLRQAIDYKEKGPYEPLMTFYYDALEAMKKEVFEKETAQIFNDYYLTQKDPPKQFFYSPNYAKYYQEMMKKHEEYMKIPGEMSLASGVNEYLIGFQLFLLRDYQNSLKWFQEALRLGEKKATQKIMQIYFNLGQDTLAKLWAEKAKKWMIISEEDVRRFISHPFDTP